MTEIPFVLTCWHISFYSAFKLPVFPHSVIKYTVRHLHDDDVQFTF